MDDDCDKIPLEEWLEFRDQMIIKRIKSPPSKNTFLIKPIAKLLQRYVRNGKGWIDPFAGNNSPAEFTNDLNPNTKTKYHLEALEFCKMMNKKVKFYNGVLFDPPYSPRQIKEVYEGIGLKTNKKTIQASFWWSIKNILAPKIKPNGLAISCCWNTSGFGKQNGFEIIEILLVNHSAHHNDTIVTVEKKIQGVLI